MLFANVCAGFISCCYGECGFWRFCAFFWLLLGTVCVWGVLVLLFSLLCAGFGLHRCASCWTRPGGGGRWEHYLCNLWGECLTVHKTACMYLGIREHFVNWKPCMLALAGQPSLHGYDACMDCWTKGALRRISRHKQCETSFSTFWVYLFSLNSRVRFWGLILWHFWIGRARHPGPTSLPRHVDVEVFMMEVGSHLVN